MNRDDMEAKRLAEEALGALPEPALPPGLYQRVLNAQFAPAAKRRSIAALLKDLWPQAVGLAAASVLGVLGGFMDPGLMGEPETDLTPYILALDTGGETDLTEDHTP